VPDRAGRSSGQEGEERQQQHMVRLPRIDQHLAAHRPAQRQARGGHQQLAAPACQQSTLEQRNGTRGTVDRSDTDHGTSAAAEELHERGQQIEQQRAGVVEIGTRRQ